MALVVNRIETNQNETGFPVVYRNLVHDRVTSMGEIANGTGTITEDANGQYRDCDSGVSGGQAYIFLSIDVLSGKSYIFGCDVENLSGTPTKNVLLSTASQDSETTPAPDKTITATANGTWCGYFRCTDDDTETFRFGVGANSSEAANVSMRIRNIFCYELDTYPVNDSTKIPGPGDVINGSESGIAYASGPPYTYATSGAMTLAGGTPQYNNAMTQRMKVGFMITDSFGDDSTDLPFQLAQKETGLLLFCHATSGQALHEVITGSIHTDLMDFDNFDYPGTAYPEFVIIQSSVNDLLDDRTAQQMIDSAESIIDAAITRGLIPICTTVTPVNSLTAARQEVLNQYNWRLPALVRAKGGFLADYHRVLADPSDATQILPAFNADGTHPNVTGYQALATEIQRVLAHIRELEMVKTRIKYEGIL